MEKYKQLTSARTAAYAKREQTMDLIAIARLPSRISTTKQQISIVQSSKLELYRIIDAEEPHMSDLEFIRVMKYMDSGYQKIDEASKIMEKAKS